ncbi:MAG TPA: hypothetical protein VFF52_22430 [Isosphaeraceae bacterium]|nr:hypothetical protein [Isosphaeraceae bacterium]
MVHEYDITSKYLIQHHGGSILRLAGVRDIASWTPLQAELILARRLPDGFLEVLHHGQTRPDPYILEIATYPQARVAKQVVDDALLVYFERRVLPEVVVLFLHPRGNVATAQTAQLSSRLGPTTWDVSWRSVKLWEVPAGDLLAAGDIGLIPWVPLAKIDGPPEPVFRECKARINRVMSEGERQSLLVVTHFLASLRYDDARLLKLLMGRKAMLESKSPIVRELRAEWTREGRQAMILDTRGSLWDEGQETRDQAQVHRG